MRGLRRRPDRALQNFMLLNGPSAGVRMTIVGGLVVVATCAFHLPGGGRYDGLAPGPRLLARAALMVAVYAIFAAMLPTYTSLKGGAALLDGAVLTGLIALGVGLTMIAGEMDPSVGSMAALCGVIAVKLAPSAGPMPAILAAAAFAAGLGALRAGDRLAAHQLDDLHHRHADRPARHHPDRLGRDDRADPVRPAGDDGRLRRPLPGLLAAQPDAARAAALAVGLFANRTLWGRELYAIGGGRAEARAAGVSIRRPIVLAFALSAGPAGWAAPSRRCAPARQPASASRRCCWRPSPPA